MTVQLKPKNSGAWLRPPKASRRDPSLRTKCFAQDDRRGAAGCGSEEFECKLRLRFGDRFVSDQEKKQPQPPPPIICVNDRILVQYAVLNEAVGFNSGHHLMFVGDKEIGRVPCLAICRDRDSARFFLYFCGKDWSMVGVASYDTVAAAKQRAERIYPGSSGCWAEAHFTEEDRERFLEEKNSWTRCSFCGKRDDGRLFSETFEGNGTARICGNCVREFYNDLQKPSPDTV